MLLQLRDQGIQCSNRIVMLNFSQLKMSCDIPVGQKEIGQFQEAFSYPETGGHQSLLFLASQIKGPYANYLFFQRVLLLSYLLSSVCFQIFFNQRCNGSMYQRTNQSVKCSSNTKKCYVIESCLPFSDAVCKNVQDLILLAAASIAERQAPKESVQNLKVLFIFFYLFFFFSFQANQI